MPDRRIRLSIDGKPHPTSQLLGVYGIQALSNNGHPPNGEGARALSNLARRLGWDQLYFNTSEQTVEIDLAIWEHEQDYIVFCRGTQNGTQLAEYLCSIVAINDVRLRKFAMNWAKLQGDFIVDTLREVIEQVERRKPGRAAPLRITFFAHSLGSSGAYIGAQYMNFYMRMANQDRIPNYRPDIQIMSYGEPKSCGARSAIVNLLGDEALNEFFWETISGTGLPLLFSQEARNGETREHFVERMTRAVANTDLEPTEHIRIVGTRTAGVNDTWAANGSMLKDPITLMPPGFIIDANFLGLFTRAIPAPVRARLGRLPSPIMNPPSAGFWAKFGTGAFWFTLAQVAGSRYLASIVPVHIVPAFYYGTDGVEDFRRNNFIENWLMENFIGAAEHAFQTGWGLHLLGSSYGPMAIGRYNLDRERRVAAGEGNLDDIIPQLVRWNNREVEVRRVNNIQRREPRMPQQNRREMRLPRYMEGYIIEQEIILKEALSAAAAYIIARRGGAQPALVEYRRLLDGNSSIVDIVHTLRTGQFAAEAESALMDVWLQFDPGAVSDRFNRLNPRNRTVPSIPPNVGPHMESVFPLDTQMTQPVYPTNMVRLQGPPDNGMSLNQSEYVEGQIDTTSRGVRFIVRRAPNGVLYPEILSTTPVVVEQVVPVPSMPVVPSSLIRRNQGR